MKLGIIGLPQSGKTTIFNALTRGNTPTTASAGRFEVHNAVVDVPDPRVTDATLFAGGLAFPAAFTFAPDGHVFYGERLTGQIRTLDANGNNDTLFFAVPDLVAAGEQGLLGRGLRQVGVGGVAGRRRARRVDDVHHCVRPGDRVKLLADDVAQESALRVGALVTARAARHDRDRLVGRRRGAAEQPAGE